jgi:hypothetical protein
MTARIALGWVDPADLASEEEEVTGEETAEPQAEPTADSVFAKGPEA